MIKVRLVVDTGFCNATYEEEVEVEEINEKALSNMLESMVFENIYSYWEIIKDEDEEAEEDS